MKIAEQHVILIRKTNAETAEVFAEIVSKYEFWSIGRSKGKVHLSDQELETLSITLDDSLVGFCGAAIIEGHPELWLIMTDPEKTRQLSRFVIRTLKRAIRAVADRMKWSYVRCMALKTAPRNFHRFVELLGFKAIEERIGYGPAKADFTLYELSYQ